MKVVKDQWSGLFKQLAERVSAQGRQRLLFQMIGDIQDITMLNFGAEGIARPENWKALTRKYANRFHSGDTTPKLILTGHLLASFKHTIGNNTATLTNTADYADAHHFGEKYRNLPRRRFYPVTDEGQLTDFALARQREILNAHFQIGKTQEPF